MLNLFSLLKNTPKLIFRASLNNPTFAGAGEVEIIMQDDGRTCDAWIRKGTNTGVQYTYADNPLLDNWATYVTCTGIPNGLFPTVFRYLSSFYMLHRKDSDQNTYLYTSTNRIDWTVLNSGNPVITRSTTASAWNRNMYNTSVWLVGSTVYFLLEASADTGFYSFPSVFGLGSFDLNSPGTLTLSSLPIVPNGACPNVVLSKGHNALAVIYTEFNLQYSTPPTQYMAETRCIYAYLNDDLTKPSSWKQSLIRFPEFGENKTVNNQWEADFSVVFTPTKGNPMMMYTCHNQATGYQYYSDIKNENDFFYAVRSA